MANGLKFNQRIRDKLDRLPAQPGVYMMRDRGGRVIYIGKATSLRSRVRHYFQPGTFRNAPPKLRGLIRSIDDLDFITVRTEAEAVLTEARMIKEYKPRYNVLMRDDKRFLLLKINLNDPVPLLQTCRLKKPDGATYFGPYRSSAAARAALEFVDKQFGLRRCKPREPGADDYAHCMNDIIRFCSAPCIGRISREAYMERVQEACAFLRGERRELLGEVRDNMQTAAAAQDFEKAAAYRDMFQLLQEAVKRNTRLAKPPRLRREEARQGLAALQSVLSLKAPPAVIECYDISNISGTFSVASLVAAEDGRPAPRRYRHFKIKTVDGIDDPRSMAEVIQRRFRRALDEKQHLPDLVIVDGGITQLRAARAALTELGLDRQPVTGLAKRYEELITEESGRVVTHRFEPGSPGLHLIQQIRDEAHRFALTYHRKLRNERIRESSLDDIPGMGDSKKKLLLKTFGSISRLKKCSIEELTRAPGIGLKTAHLVHAALHPSVDD